MIRALAISIWIVSITLAAVYFGHSMKSSGAAHGAAEQVANAPTTIKIKSMTVPVVGDGTVQGYILTQLTISAKPDLLKTLPQPPDLLLGDEVFKNSLCRGADRF